MMQPLMKPMTLIRETWQTFLKTWDTTVRYSGWYVAISVVSAITIYLKTGQAGTQLIGSILQFFTLLASLYLSVRIYQLVFSIEDQKAQSPSQPQQVWKIVGQTLISIVMIAVPVMIGISIIIATLAISASNAIGIGIACLLMIALAIALIYGVAVRLSFAQTHIIDQTKGPVEAFKYSWKITQNRFWAIFGRTMLGGLIFGALVIALSAAAIIIVSLVSGVDIASAMSEKNPSPAISSMTELIQGIIIAAILPLFYIFKVKMYRDIEKMS